MFLKFSKIINWHMNTHDDVKVIIEYRDMVDLIYKKIKNFEKPMIRVCADIKIDISDKLYEEIFSYAAKKSIDGSAAFILGEYEEELEPRVKEILERKDIKYSCVEIDGVKRKGKEKYINLAIWLKNKDIEKTPKKKFIRAFDKVNIIYFGERVRSFDELNEESKKSFIITGGYIFMEYFKMKSPHIMNIYFAYIDEDLSYFDRVAHSISLYNKYLVLPPCVWNLYDRDSSNPELIEEFKEMYYKIRRETFPNILQQLLNIIRKI